MARISQQEGKIEARQRKRGLVYVLRYRIRQDDRWIQKTEELRDEAGRSFHVLDAAKEPPKAVQSARAKRMVDVNGLNNNPKPSVEAEPSAEVEPQKLMTVAEFIAGSHWQDHIRRKVKVSTAYNYNSLLKTYVLPLIGQRPMEAVTPSDVSGVMNARERAGSTPMSMRNLYGILHAIFDIAVESDLIGRSPVRRRLHWPEFESGEKLILTAGQIRRVIEETSEEHRPMLLIVALTGLRVGELLALRWKNVDLAGRRLSVTNTLWLGMLLTPKTKRSQRQIHIPEALANSLAAHHVRARFTGADDFVFAREDGSPLRQQHIRDYVLYPALKRAGIERVKGQHGFHLFRHSVATIVYDATKDLKLGQELLGHSTINTTGNIYTHTDSAAKEATELLAREIVGSGGLTVAWETDRVQ